MVAYKAGSPGTFFRPVILINFFLQQVFYRSGGIHAAHIGYLGQGGGLAVGDDRQGLQRSQGQLCGLLDGKKRFQLIVQVGLGHQLQPAAGPLEKKPPLRAVLQMLFFHGRQYFLEIGDVLDLQKLHDPSRFHRFLGNKENGFDQGDLAGDLFRVHVFQLSSLPASFL